MQVFYAATDARLRSRTKDKRAGNQLSDVLPFGRLWYGAKAVTNAIGYAMRRSRSHDAVIRVYGAAGKVIETHKYAGGV